MNTLNIYIEKSSSRVEYITRLFFRELVGIEVKLLHEPTIGQEIHLIYGERKIMDELLLKPCGLLTQKGIRQQEIPVFDWKDTHAFYATEDDFGFDVLSASFYLVTRYEEYLPFKKDKHGRYDPHQSLAYREGFLQKPLLNIWASHMRNLLKQKHPSLLFKEPKFNFINTVDVDNAYAYLEKGFVRTTGALIRDTLFLNFKEVSNRVKTLIGKKRDIFDNFDWLIDFQKKKQYPSVYFWLVADYDVNDKNVPYSSRKFRSLIKSVNDYADTGVHPSYASNFTNEKVKMELQRLSNAIHMPVKKSRQHFLKFELPDTYRLLIENEIEEDYSMGYPSELGFRASICSPFPFYDLKNERITRLTVYPFYIMEATLKYYKSIDPEEAMSHFIPIIDEVKKVNGTMVSLWHNDSLSDTGEWKGWKSVYVKTIEYIMG